MWIDVKVDIDLFFWTGRRMVVTSTDLGLNLNRSSKNTKNLARNLASSLYPIHSCFVKSPLKQN
jgi:hypothetical protein